MADTHEQTQSGSGFLNILDKNWVLWLASFIIALLLEPFFGSSLLGAIVGGGWTGLLANGIVPLLIVGGVVFLLFTMMRGEGSLMNTRVYNNLIARAQRNRVLSKILAFFHFRQKNIEAELTPILMNLRFEIYTLINWMLRHDVWNLKATGLTNKRNTILEHEIGGERVVGKQIMTLDRIHNDSIRKYLEGDEITLHLPAENPNNPTPEELKNARWIYGRGDAQKSVLGWSRSHRYVICELMNQLKNDLEKNFNIDPPGRLDSHWGTNRSNQLGRIFNQIYQRRDAFYGQYYTGVRRFRLYHRMRDVHNYSIDMYNMYGVYKRGMLFARPEARPIFYKVDAQEGFESDNGITRSIDYSKLEFDEKETRKYQEKKRLVIKKERINYDNYPFLVEVNIHGWCVTDLNNIEVNRKQSQGLIKKEGGKNYLLLRKYLKEDLIFLSRWYDDTDSEEEKQKQTLPTLSEVLTSSVREWEFALKDMDRAIYHPFSRKITDYSEIIGKVNFNFRNVPFIKPLDTASIGFDREGLKIAGKLVPPGQRRYYDTDEKTIITGFPQNVYPAISLHGLYLFISEVGKQAMEDGHEAEQYLVDHFTMRYKPLLEVKYGGES